MTELEKDINNLRTGLKSVETVSDILSFSLQLQHALQLVRSSSVANVSIYTIVSLAKTLLSMVTTHEN